MTTDFELFKRGLKSLYEKLKDHVKFKTLEGQIDITIKGDGLGHFSVDCEVMDEAGIGNKLNVTMAFDQTQIPDFVRRLDKITKQFPIRGTDLAVKSE
jgi:hypothetical protein